MFLGMTILFVMFGAVLAETPPKPASCKYTVHQKKLPWTRALAECMSTGGALATVGENEINQILTEIIKAGKNLIANNAFWLGASCDNNCKPKDTSGWYWMSNAKSVQDGFWAKDQPDNNCDTSDYTPKCIHDCRESERVLLLKNMQFHDRGYWEEHMFICEKCEGQEQASG